MARPSRRFFILLILVCLLILTGTGLFLLNQRVGRLARVSTASSPPPQFKESIENLPQRGIQIVQSNESGATSVRVTGRLQNRYQQGGHYYVGLATTTEAGRQILLVIDLGGEHYHVAEHTVSFDDDSLIRQDNYTLRPAVEIYNLLSGKTGDTISLELSVLDDFGTRPRNCDEICTARFDAFDKHHFNNSKLASPSSITESRLEIGLVESIRL